MQGLPRWAAGHPGLGEIARALADPAPPDAGALASLAGLLLLGTLAFAFTLGLTMAAAPDRPLNQFVLHLALSLQSPGAHFVLAGFSRLGDVGVIVPLGLAVLVWSLARGWRRPAGYWLAALAFALLAAPLHQVVLRGPRPDLGLSGLSPWAFPSGHVLRATVVYGFPAVWLARPLGPAWRGLP